MSGKRASSFHHNKKKEICSDMPCISYTQLSVLPWKLCSTLSEHIPCALRKWSGHLSQFSPDGLKHNEVILSCKQLIPNSKSLFLKRGAQLPRT